MKSFLLIGFALLVLGMLCEAFGANDWFVSPSAGLVFPNSSVITYHSMSGRVDYKTGYAQGLQFGRNIGQFKLYVEYTHSSFKARDLTLQTPYGQVSQADSDNQDQHTVTINADYSHVLAMGLAGYVGLGAGAAFDSTTSPVIEGRCGLSHTFGGRASPFRIAIEYGYRWTDGSQKFGHKTDGSYSIVVDRPDQQMLTISIGKNF